MFGKLRSVTCLSTKHDCEMLVLQEMPYFQSYVAKVEKERELDVVLFHGSVGFLG